MTGLFFLLASCASQVAPTPATADVVPAVAPGAPAAVGVSSIQPAGLMRVVEEATAPDASAVMPVAPSVVPPGATVPGYAVSSPYAASAAYAQAAVRSPFQSDHEFDGFVGPMTDPIQAKDARSLTEARLIVLSNWSKPGTPVLGSGTFQIYALQLRLALTERLQIFADKDGIVRVSPRPATR